jgi:peptide/nickel transport system substrate-binding protein
MGESNLGLRYWQSRRVSRRKVITGAAVGGAAVGAMSIVGCGGDKKGTPGSGAAPAPSSVAEVTDGSEDGPAKPGGILNIRQIQDVLPNMKVFGPSGMALSQGLVLGFTTYDHMWYTPSDTGVVELFLATRLEQPDPLTIIATLGDATFHDKPPVNGRKVTAEDVEASFKRFRDEIGAGFDWLHNIMDDIVAVDERTIKITQKQPWAWVFTSSNAGSPITSSILPKEILHNDDILLKDAIGSGQWVLGSHDNGANIQLKKFQDFRQFAGTKPTPGQPFLDGISNKTITNNQAALAAFKAGEIDMYTFTSRTESADTKGQMGDKIAVSSDLGRDYTSLMLKYEPPFLDERVRQAFNLLIDRDEAIQLLTEDSALKAGPIPPAHKLYTLPEDDSDLQEYFRHDIADAKKLLDAASFDYNQEIELKHPIRPIESELAQVLQAQLKRGGVKVKLVPEDLVRWIIQTLGQGEFRMTCFQHLPYEDPDAPLRLYLSGEGDRKNYMGYKDAEVDAAVLAAAGEMDQTARIEKAKAAQKIIMKKHAPMLNLFSRIGYEGRYSYVKGSISGRGSYGLFSRTVWLDKKA